MLNTVYCRCDPNAGAGAGAGAQAVLSIFRCGMRTRSRRNSLRNITHAKLIWSEAEAIGSEAFVERFGSRALRGRIESVLDTSLCEDQPMYTLTRSTRDQKVLWAQQQS